MTNQNHHYMKTRILTIALLAASMLTACKSGLSGEITTEEIGIKPDFETIKISGYARVTTNMDGKFVAVTTDKDLQKYVKVAVKGRTLVIKANSDKIKRAGERPVSISLPYSSVFKELKMEGSSTFDFETMLAPHIKIELEGANIITGPLCCETMKLESEGSDQILIDTDAEKIDLDLNGSSTAGTLMIPIKAARINCSLKGSCVAYVESGETKGSVEDNSELHYVGDQECRAKASGSARIINDPDREPMDITKIPRKL